MARSKATDRQVEALLCECEALDCRVREGKHFLILLPDGKSMVTLAGSPSDIRAIPNTRARLRRLGVPVKRG